MYSIQNMTNSTLKFQGITIGAYMTVDVPCITDFVALSRLSNSGKIRYFEAKRVVKAPVEKKVVESTKKEVSKPEIQKEIKKVEPILTVKPILTIDPVEEKKEKKVSEVVESLVDVNENEEETFTIPEAKDKYVRKGRKSGNKK